MVNNEVKFVIDASSLIEIYKQYPQSLPVFNDIWNKLSYLLENGILISSAEIFDEIKDVELKEWLKEYKDKFLPLDKSIQEKTKEILSNFPEMININKGKKSSSNGDPFLIATAIIKKGIIVTEERKGKNKIPDVAANYGIKTMSHIDFIMEIMKK